jgi:hypothetical protein
METKISEFDQYRQESSMKHVMERRTGLYVFFQYTLVLVIQTIGMTSPNRDAVPTKEAAIQRTQANDTEIKAYKSMAVRIGTFLAK